MLSGLFSGETLLFPTLCIVGASPTFSRFKRHHNLAARQLSPEMHLPTFDSRAASPRPSTWYRSALLVWRTGEVSNETPLERIRFRPGSSCCGWLLQYDVYHVRGPTKPLSIPNAPSPNWDEAFWLSQRSRLPPSSAG